MADYVLDTHAIVFHLTAPRKVGRRARAVLKRVDAGRDRAFLPAATVAEVVLLRELGRIRVGLPELRTVMEDVLTIRFLPLDLDQLSEFGALTSLRDPFDRLIVAAARAQNARLISKDSVIEDSGLVENVWS